MKSGFIIINKPVGPTSHDIVDKLRRITGIKKIGHAGTLDPLASGVLILAIGREATKKIDKLVKTEKEYITDIYLGAITDTYDRTGKIIRVSKEDKVGPDLKQIKLALQNFLGEQDQIPPMYSAKKVNGKKLYQLARQGHEIERRPSKITIHSIKLLKYIFPELKIKINCSSGTYIRSLAHDLGQFLGCGAYLKELQRTKVGEFGLDQALELKDLNSDNWQKYLLP